MAVSKPVEGVADDLPALPNLEARSAPAGGPKPNGTEPTATLGLPPGDLLDIHRRMVRIRTFEDEAGRMAENGFIPGALHL